MDTMHAHDVAVDAQEVFSLPGLLDQSAALAAAQRLYAQNRAGLRFFCENRRVVSVDEAQAMDVDAHPLTQDQVVPVDQFGFLDEAEDALDLG